MEKEADGDVFELTDSEHVLNLEFYLHRAILKWQDALESALRQGNEQGIGTGLTNRGLAGDMVVGIAEAKGIIHWKREPVPAKDDKHKKKAIENNKEAEKFKTEYDKFKADLEKDAEMPKDIRKAKLADYKVFEVLKKISKSSTKKGTVIV